MQSMNFLAGLLLLFMPEERAFWVLCYVVEDLLEDYFVKRYNHREQNRMLSLAHMTSAANEAASLIN